MTKPLRPISDETSPTPPGPGRLPSQIAWRALLVPLTVLLPLVTLAPTADHRFNIYWHGADFRSHPLRLVTENLHTVPYYLARGNFRPIGRMAEDIVDLAAYLLMESLRLPADIAFRLVSFLAAAVLTGAAVVLAESLLARGTQRGRTPSRLAALIPFAVGAGFVAAGPNSTTVLFGGLYLLSTALVLTVAAALCRSVTAEPRRAGRLPALGAIVAGGFLAAFNEVACLAPALALVAVLVRARVVLGLDWRSALTGRGARLVGLLWLGFLPIFVPVRVAIHHLCRTGTCYSGSDVTLGSGAALTLPNRLLSWLPPLQWHAAGWSMEIDLVTVLALTVLTVLAWLTAVNLPAYASLDRRQAAGVAIVGGTLLVLAAAMAAMNDQTQADAAAGRWGLGWRDSGATTVGGTLVLLAGCVAVVRDRIRLLAGLLAVLVAAGAVSAAANRQYLNRNRGTTANVLNNAIAHEIAVFDDSAAGNKRRCALRTAFAAIYNKPGVGDDSAELPGARTALGRFDATLNLGSKGLNGHPFCVPPKP
ncbi:hypothetical protein [Paractinoplanes toevensis]|uniref:Uncharacterized protein n=1 Tax=Paractinoplanes toevensis TaxID=571911 RepID=A0A920BPB8_9ACTN|nr:hypothetical protein [Actinoplanes toevensis]GIM96657.1 hypothetical protein Ato02nite_084500 [Actinoplanes toevensis]